MHWQTSLRVEKSPRLAIPLTIQRARAARCDAERVEGGELRVAGTKNEPVSGKCGAGASVPGDRPQGDDGAAEMVVRLWRPVNRQHFRGLSATAGRRGTRATFLGCAPSSLL